MDLDPSSADWDPRRPAGAADPPVERSGRAARARTARGQPSAPRAADPTTRVRPPPAAARSTGRTVAAALGVGLGVLLVIGAVAGWSIWRVIRANPAVAHSYEIGAGLADVRAGVSRADAGLRAAAATGDTAALAELEAGIAQSADAIARLQRRTAGAMPAAEPPAAAALLRERGALLDTLALLASAGSARPAGLVPRLRAGRALTARLGAGAQRLDALERALLRERLAATARTARGAIASIASVGLLAALLAVLARRSFRRDLAGRLEADTALRASEARLQAVFDQTFQLTVLLSPAGDALEVNETAAALLGVRPDAVGIGPFARFDWVGEDARALLETAIAQAAAGAFVRLRPQLRTADGDVAWLDLSLKPIRDGEGRITLLVAEGRDVTEQRAVEAALRESEARFSGILEIAADAVISVDEAQRIVYFNHSAEVLFGHRAAEVVGRPLDLLLPERLRTAHRGHVASFGASGQRARRMGGRSEIRALRRNGEEFPAEASISVLESGGRRLYTAMLRDISDRVRLERRQQFLAAAGETLASSLDVRVTLERVAQLAVPILGEACLVDLEEPGLAPEVVVAHVDVELAALMRTMWRRFPPDPEGAHPLAVTRRTGEPIFLPELAPAQLTGADPDPLHAATIERLHLRSALFVPLIARGRTLGVLGSYSSTRALDEQDLDLARELARRAALAVDNARSFEAARAASRARDVVLGIVSHDLRNPISAISMCANALVHGVAPAEVPEIAQTIRRSTRWMQHIIRDLLDVTAIEGGRLTVQPEPTTSASIVEALCDIYEPLAAERGVTLVTVGAGGHHRFDGDADRIVQAVGNLLGNAIKFTPRGGHVTLTVARDGDDMRFEVADTGRGIPPEHLPHLFDRYWQARETRRGGAGLGLAIARGIAEAHGGRIEVDSAPGVGSRFTLVLPARRAAAVVG